MTDQLNLRPLWLQSWLLACVWYSFIHHKDSYMIFYDWSIIKTLIRSKHSDNMGLFLVSMGMHYTPTQVNLHSSSVQAFQTRSWKLHILPTDNVRTKGRRGGPVCGWLSCLVVVDRHWKPFNIRPRLRAICDLLQMIRGWWEKGPKKQLRRFSCRTSTNAVSPLSS